MRVGYVETILLNLCRQGLIIIIIISITIIIIIIIIIIINLPFYLVWEFSGHFIPQAGDREKPVNCSHNREFSRKFESFGRSGYEFVRRCNHKVIVADGCFVLHDHQQRRLLVSCCNKNRSTGFVILREERGFIWS